MQRIFRWAWARVAAIVVFVVSSLSSCSIVHWGYQEIVLPERTDFSDGAVPAKFLVAVQASPGSGPGFELVDWTRANEIARSEPARLWMSGAREMQREDVSRGFRVVGQGATHQIVEVWHRNTISIDTRYRVEHGRIEPLYYRSDGGFGSAILVLPLNLLCLLFSLWLAGTTAARLTGERQRVTV